MPLRITEDEAYSTRLLDSRFGRYSPREGSGLAGQFGVILMSHTSSTRWMEKQTHQSQDPPGPLSFEPCLRPLEDSLHPPLPSVLPTNVCLLAYLPRARTLAVPHPSHCGRPRSLHLSSPLCLILSTDRHRSDILLMKSWAWPWLFQISFHDSSKASARSNPPSHCPGSVSFWKASRPGVTLSKLSTFSSGILSPGQTFLTSFPTPEAPLSELGVPLSCVIIVLRTQIKRVTKPPS